MVKVGQVKGSPTDILRDFVTVPTAIGMGTAGGIIGSLGALIVTPYIAKSEKGEMFGQVTAMIMLGDQVLSMIFGQQTEIVN